MNSARDNRKILAIVSLAAAGILGATVIGSQAFIATASTQDSSPMDQQGAQEETPSWLFKVNRKYNDYENGVLKVRAGVGGPISPLTWFFPQNAQIKVGETVAWYNPTKVAEPHTITFMKSPASFAPIEAPFIVANGTTFSSPDPAMNAEPSLLPGPNGTQIAIVANARATMPVTITGEEVEYLPLNSNYTLTGDEDYVNSGWLWPDGQTPPGLPEIETFSVKFEEAGTYQYLCLIHPWMAGTVTVS